MSLLLKQKLASVVDRYPAVLSEVRGEGLLVGVKAVVPVGRSRQCVARRETADRRRRRQCGALPGAVDRERGRDRPVRRRCSSARALALAGAAVEEGGGMMSKSVRHFLDISELPPSRAAQHAGRQHRHEGEAEGARKSRAAARRQDAGDDLRTAVDAHARFVRRRHAPARRRADHADRRTRCSSAAARPSPTPRACCRAMSMRS